MKSVIFIHPDLGIGGAERLIVDAACGLQNLHHEIFMYTQHHDPSHCFKETLPIEKGGSFKHPVRVVGDWMPRFIRVPFTSLRVLHILFATLRMMYCALYIALFHKEGPIESIVVDQISACIPVFRLFPSTRKARILFYCHFPDKLLSQQRDKWWKSLYRIPFDYLEEMTTSMADLVMVNSNFTKSVYSSVFPRVRRMNKPGVSQPEVLYPPIHCENYDAKPSEQIKPNDQLRRIFEDSKSKGLKVVVSINRFERKKAVHLAIEAFARLQSLLPSTSANEFSKYRLVLAGGYDPRVQENVEYMEELKNLLKKHGLKEGEQQVLFVPSFNDADRYLLLHQSNLIVYTPENEHFGIVPVEAQYCRRNIVACASGGPLESIENGPQGTGLLVEPTADGFAKGMIFFLHEQSQKQNEAMGERARERVKRLFSLDAFSSRLSGFIEQKSQ